MGKYYEANKDHINKYKMAHSIGVAEYMRERAPDYAIDPDEAYIVGLLHDIGYLQGRQHHENSGRNILDCMGLLEDYVRPIGFHGTDPNRVIDLFGEEAITPMLVMLYEADLSVNRQGFRVGFDQRYKEIANNTSPEFAEEAARTVKATQAFVKEWQVEHNIPAPEKGFFNRDAVKERHSYGR